MRSIRERLRQSTTGWCAMALDPEGEPAGHVGITPAAERDRPHVRDPPPRAFVDAVRAPAVVGERAGGAPAPPRPRRGRPRWPRDDRLYTPHGAARARVFYEREGLLGRSRAGSFSEPMLGLDLVEYRRAL